MKLLQNSSAPESATADFDLLRARVEGDVQRPAVVAITASTAGDGKEMAARGLAYALAEAGYQTLFIDATPSRGSGRSSMQAPTLEEIARRLTIDSGVGNLAVAIVDDPALQRRTSQRNVQSALDMLRSKFDYIVVSAESGTSSPFGAAIVSGANAVLVTVKKGRRQKSGDARLATTLKRLGARFLGVVALDSSVTEADPSTLAAPAAMYVRREVAEWPT